MNSKVYLYEQHHRNNLDYGEGALHLEQEVSLLIDMLHPKVVLDYGCGKGKLVRLLSRKYPHIAFFGYDPAIPELSNLPTEKADLIINTDVLEHIPEDELPATIAKIRSISDHVFFNLCHTKAAAILPNGENAHCTVKDKDWYCNLFKHYFSTVLPLPGATDHTSAVVTFPLTDVAKSRYLCIAQEKEELQRIKKSRTFLYNLKYFFSPNFSKSYEFHKDMDIASLRKMRAYYTAASKVCDIMPSVATVFAMFVPVFILLYQMMIDATKSLNDYHIELGLIENAICFFTYSLGGIAFLLLICAYIKYKRSLDLEVIATLLEEKR